LKRGGFNLTKFVTNSKQVLEEIEVKDRAKEVKIELGDDVCSKALGITWEVCDDKFCISIGNCVRSDEVLVKRQMLSIIASMYDPLGLVSPCILVGKMLFQEATRLKVDWDEEVPYDVLRKWKIWMEGVADLQGVQFPRCLIPRQFCGARLEIHNFADASEKAYGCCCYLRCIKPDEVHTVLIASKGRVCPIKQVTIPRLELQAAVLSSQMNHMMISELDLEIEESYFWSDSQIVLAYIKNDEKRLKVYVANRVSTIRNLSNKEQWNYIPSKENPADIVSRGANKEELNSEMWLQGPAFLKNQELPVKKMGDIKTELLDDDIEVKKITNLASQAQVDKSNTTDVHFIDQIIQHYSSWYKIKRIVATLMKVKDKLLKRDTEFKITAENLMLAERIILKHIQASNYKQEIQDLSSNQALKKSSTIRNLLPYIDEEGLVCVGGRVKTITEDFNEHPYIIPYQHQAAERIARYYHEEAHLGTEWTLALIRKKFWIVRGRIVIKRIKNECLTCKKWIKSYLPELQTRSKWLRTTSNLKPGDLVLLLEENTPRFLWPMGVVQEIKLGRDGLVRIVKVKTKSTVLVRPVSKVVALECLG